MYMHKHEYICMFAVCTTAVRTNGSVRMRTNYIHIWKHICSECIVTLLFKEFPDTWQILCSTKIEIAFVAHRTPTVRIYSLWG